MNEPKKPKFAAGDTVEVQGKFGIVEQVFEENYFWGDPSHVYFEYNVRFDNGDVFRYTEAILTQAQNRVGRLCECGAWSIDWFGANHSRWCPAYKTFERFDEND
jgi:hypothetical protein